MYDDDVFLVVPNRERVSIAIYGIVISSTSAWRACPPREEPSLPPFNNAYE